MNTTIMLSLSTMMMMLVLSHPILLMIILIMQTLGTLMMPNALSENSWVSYIIFLIFLGGLLIIFTYLASMVPNELMTNKLYVSFIIILPPLSWAFYNFLLKGLPTPSNNLLFLINYNMSLNMLPTMMGYLLMTMCLSVFLGSSLKTPIKQSIN